MKMRRILIKDYRLKNKRGKIQKLFLVLSFFSILFNSLFLSIIPALESPVQADTSFNECMIELHDEDYCNAHFGETKETPSYPNEYSTQYSTQYQGQYPTQYTPPVADGYTSEYSSQTTPTSPYDPSTDPEAGASPVTPLNNPLPQSPDDFGPTLPDATVPVGAEDTDPIAVCIKDGLSYEDCAANYSLTPSNTTPVVTDQQNGNSTPNRGFWAGVGDFFNGVGTAIGNIAANVTELGSNNPPPAGLASNQPLLETKVTNAFDLENRKIEDQRIEIANGVFLDSSQARAYLNTLGLNPNSTEEEIAAALGDPALAAFLVKSQDNTGQLASLATTCTEPPKTYCEDGKAIETVVDCKGVAISRKLEVKCLPSGLSAQDTTSALVTAKQEENDFGKNQAAQAAQKAKNCTDQATGEHYSQFNNDVYNKCMGRPEGTQVGFSVSDVGSFFAGMAPNPSVYRTGYLGDAQTQQACFELESKLISDRWNFSALDDAGCIKDTRTSAQREADAERQFAETKNIPVILRNMGGINSGDPRVLEVANGLGLDLNNPQDWTESQAKTFLREVNKKDTNPLKWAVENLLPAPIPLADYERVQIARDVCREKHGNACDYQDPSLLTVDPNSGVKLTVQGDAIINMNPDDFSKLGDVMTTVYGDKPSYTLQTMQSYAKASQDCDRLSDDQSALRQKCYSSYFPTTSEESLAEIKSGYDQYLQALIYGVGNTPEAKLLAERKDEAGLNTVVGIASNTIDPSDIIHIGINTAVISAVTYNALVTRVGAKAADEAIAKAGVRIVGEEGFKAAQEAARIAARNVNNGVVNTGINLAEAVEKAGNGIQTVIRSAEELEADAARVITTNPAIAPVLDPVRNLADDIRTQAGKTVNDLTQILDDIVPGAGPIVPALANIIPVPPALAPVLADLGDEAKALLARNGDELAPTFRPPETKTPVKPFEPPKTEPELNPMAREDINQALSDGEKNTANPQVPCIPGVSLNILDFFIKPVFAASDPCPKTYAWYDPRGWFGNNETDSAAQKASDVTPVEVGKTINEPKVVKVKIGQQGVDPQDLVQFGQVQDREQLLLEGVGSMKTGVTFLKKDRDLTQVAQTPYIAKQLAKEIEAGEALGDSFSGFKQKITDAKTGEIVGYSITQPQAPRLIDLESNGTTVSLTSKFELLENVSEVQVKTGKPIGLITATEITVDSTGSKPKLKVSGLNQLNSPSIKLESEFLVRDLFDHLRGQPTGIYNKKGFIAGQFLSDQLNQGKTLSEAIEAFKADPLRSRLIKENPTAPLPEVFPVAINPKLTGSEADFVKQKAEAALKKKLATFPNHKGVEMSDFISDINTLDGSISYAPLVYGFDPAKPTIRPIRELTSPDQLIPGETYLYATTNDGRMAVQVAGSDSDPTRGRHLAIAGYLAAVDEKGIPHIDNGIIAAGEIKVDPKSGKLLIDQQSGTYYLGATKPQWEATPTNLGNLEEITQAILGERPTALASNFEADASLVQTPSKEAAATRRAEYDQQLAEFQKAKGDKVTPLELKVEVPVGQSVPSLPDLKPITTLTDQFVAESGVAGLVDDATGGWFGDSISSVAQGIDQNLPSGLRQLKGDYVAPLFNAFIPAPVKTLDDALKAGDELIGGGQKRLSPPSVYNPQTVLEYAQKVNSEANLQKGIYTEIHLGPDGKIYIIPEVEPGSAHYASLYGEHSMLEPSVTRPGTIPVKIANGAHLSTDTILAKGVLTKNEVGDVNLAVLPGSIKRRATADKLLHELIIPGADNTAVVMAKIQETANDLGIKDLSDLSTKKPVNYQLSQVPQVTNIRNTQSLFYTPDVIPGSVGETHNGFIDIINYQEKVVQTSQGENILVQPKAAVYFDTYDAKSKTHQEAASRLSDSKGRFRDPYIVLDSSEPIELLDGSKYNARARHTIDYKNKNIQINLIIDGVNNIDDLAKLQNFEYATYSSYTNLLLAHLPKGTDPNFSVSIITSYTSKEGKVSFRTLVFPIGDAGKNLNGESFYSALAKRDYEVTNFSDLSSLPCPVGMNIPSILDLISKPAYAEAPCSGKNPIVNAWDKFKNWVTGNADNSAPEAGTLISKLPEPKTAADANALNTIQKLNNIPSEDVTALNNAAKKVAANAQDFDFVVVSGESRDVSKKLLVANGVPESKIIEIDGTANALIYKSTAPGDGELDQTLKVLTSFGKAGDAERVQVLKTVLESGGAKLDGTKKPTILFVDDHSDTGLKAASYLQRANDLGLSDAKYAALVAGEGKVIKPEVPITGFSQSELEKLSAQTINPPNLSAARTKRLVDLTEEYAIYLEVQRKIDSAPAGMHSPKVLSYIKNSKDEILGKLDSTISPCPISDNSILDFFIKPAFAASNPCPAPNLFSRAWNWITGNSEPTQEVGSLGSKLPEPKTAAETPVANLYKLPSSANPNTKMKIAAQELGEVLESEADVDLASLARAANESNTIDPELANRLKDVENSRFSFLNGSDGKAARLLAEKTAAEREAAQKLRKVLAHLDVSADNLTDEEVIRLFQGLTQVEAIPQSSRGFFAPVEDFFSNLNPFKKGEAPPLTPEQLASNADAFEQLNALGVIQRPEKLDDVMEALKAKGWKDDDATREFVAGGLAEAQKRKAQEYLDKLPLQTKAHGEITGHGVGFDLTVDVDEAVDKVIDELRQKGQNWQNDDATREYIKGAIAKERRKQGVAAPVVAAPAVQAHAVQVPPAQSAAIQVVSNPPSFLIPAFLTSPITKVVAVRTGLTLAVGLPVAYLAVNTVCRYNLFDLCPTEGSEQIPFQAPAIQSTTGTPVGATPTMPIPNAQTAGPTQPAPATQTPIVPPAVPAQPQTPSRAAGTEGENDTFVPPVTVGGIKIPDPILPILESIDEGLTRVQAEAKRIADAAKALFDQQQQKEAEEQAKAAAQSRDPKAELTYEGPGCWGRKSVILREYKDGFTEYVKDYGEIPGNCGVEALKCSVSEPAVRVYTQCGGTVGLESLDPNLAYQVSQIYDCSTKKTKFEISKGFTSPTCQSYSKENPANSRSAGQTCSSNNQCQQGLVCDQIYTNSCVKSVNLTTKSSPTEISSTKIHQEFAACQNLSSSTPYKDYACFADKTKDNKSDPLDKHHIRLQNWTNNVSCGYIIIDYGLNSACK